MAEPKGDSATNKFVNKLMDLRETVNEFKYVTGPLHRAIAIRDYVDDKGNMDVTQIIDDLRADRAKIDLDKIRASAADGFGDPSDLNSIVNYREIRLEFLAISGQSWKTLEPLYGEFQVGGGYRQLGWLKDELGEIDNEGRFTKRGEALKAILEDKKKILKPK